MNLSFEKKCNFFRLLRIFSRLAAEFEADVDVFVVFEQRDDGLHRRYFAAHRLDHVDEFGDGEDQQQIRAVDVGVPRNRTQIEFVLGEAERGDMRRSVEFVGSRKFVFAHQGGEFAVFGECDRTGAGFDAGHLIALVELLFDVVLKYRAAELAQQVVALEFHARSGVVPCAGERILRQLAVGGLVCGGRGGFFQRFLPVLRRGGASGEQERRNRQ